MPVADRSEAKTDKWICRLAICRIRNYRIIPDKCENADLEKAKSAFRPIK